MKKTTNLMKVGMNINTRQDTCRSLEEKVSKLAKIGYRYIYFDDIIFRKSNKQLEEIGKMLKNSPLKTYSAHYLPLLLRPGESVESTMCWHKENLEKAATLELRCLTCHLGNYLHNQPKNVTRRLLKPAEKKKQYSMVIDLLKRVCIEAKGLDISMAVENIPCDGEAGFKTDPISLFRSVKALKVSNLGILLDSGHANLAGINPAKAILEIKKYLCDTHLNDNLAPRFKKDLHRPVGIGNIDWFEVIQALDKVGYSRPINFELTCLHGEDEIYLAGVNFQNWECFVNLYTENRSYGN